MTGHRLLTDADLAGSRPVSEAELQAGFTEPTIWAACSECSLAWVLRRSLSWSHGWLWLWAPDCTCGKRKYNPAEPLLMSADGPYVAAEVAS